MKILIIAVLCALIEVSSAFPLQYESVPQHEYRPLPWTSVKNRRSLPAQCGVEMVKRVNKLCHNCLVINGYDLSPVEGLQHYCCRLKMCTDEYVKESICCSRFNKYTGYF
ncbi:hypothetical protein QR680_008351 [Steinernema hermaphroditum]|uniref:Uncharacterized protein n=1 Tax=Steinernema hermaphroditum TaxID=289476 RepID=A0AA39M7H8_9BILA|nr:hypothetical protein QR680_008351 [Steinernema hermaphroditum]